MVPEATGEFFGLGGFFMVGEFRWLGGFPLTPVLPTVSRSGWNPWIIYIELGIVIYNGLVK